VSHEHLGLFDTPPDRRQVLVGVAIVGLLFLASLPILVLGGVRLPVIDAFIPTVDGLMFLGEVITATFLYAQASVFQLRAPAILGTGYLLTALLLIPHALTFPGAFSSNGLLGAGASTTAWLSILRRPAFAITAILYVQFKRTDSDTQRDTERTAPNIGAHVFLAIVLAAALTFWTTRGQDWLPPLFLDRVNGVRTNLFVAYDIAFIALWAVAILMLLRRRSSVLDLWLLVALASWAIQLLLNMTVQSRFTVGFYWLYIVMLFSNLILLLALVAESTRLYARLALSMLARSREREARLMSIDALAASFSHEVGQPLSAVGIHANAGLKWLSGEQPNVERAIKSLLAVIEAKDLATGVATSIRATFAKRTGRRTEIGLADLVHATAPLLEAELAGADVSLQLALDDALPPVLADRVQLQLVLINLLTNAIESLDAIKDRPRQIAIRSATLESRGVVLEVSDNGRGIESEDVAHIFEPFFTTKPSGTGLGLSLCRIIVEAHGGRLWASRGAAFGATFHLELPASA
jgi:signal transduction histidine kinase